MVRLGIMFRFCSLLVSCMDTFGTWYSRVALLCTKAQAPDAAEVKASVG
jgi:hypothetical protein